MIVLYTRSLVHESFACGGLVHWVSYPLWVLSTWVLVHGVLFTGSFVH